MGIIGVAPESWECIKKKQYFPGSQYGSVSKPKVPPFVHIKIAGIYGCSFQTHIDICINRY